MRAKGSKDSSWKTRTLALWARDSTDTAGGARGARAGQGLGPRRATQCGGGALTGGEEAALGVGAQGQLHARGRGRELEVLDGEVLLPDVVDDQVAVVAGRDGERAPGAELDGALQESACTVSPCCPRRYRAPSGTRHAQATTAQGGMLTTASRCWW